MTEVDYHETPDHPANRFTRHRLRSCATGRKSYHGPKCFRTPETYSPSARHHPVQFAAGGPGADGRRMGIHAAPAPIPYSIGRGKYQPGSQLTGHFVRTAQGNVSHGIGPAGPLARRIDLVINPTQAEDEELDFTAIYSPDGWSAK